jgi:hypothetical protein
VVQLLLIVTPWEVVTPGGVSLAIQAGCGERRFLLLVAKP